MGLQAHLISILDGIIGGVILLLLAWAWSRGTLQMRLQSRQNRLKDLAEMERPDFFERKQRAMAVRFAVVLFASGCYTLLSFGPPVAVLIWRVAFGLCLMVCGIGALADAAVINPYGVSIRKRQYEQAAAKEELQAQQKRDLEALK